WRGTTVTTASTSPTRLVTLGGTGFPWNSPGTSTLGGISLVALILAVFAERAAGNPILPPRIFRNRTFVLTSVASLFVGVAMFGAMIYLPQYLQVVQGMSPTDSGLMTLPMVVTLFLGG